MKNKFAPFYLLILFSVYATFDAISSGSFKWGSYGYYSWIPYILVLGIISSLVPVIRSTNKNISGVFFSFFLGYLGALQTIKPIDSEITIGFEWLFVFIGAITAGMVIAAGMTLAKEL